MAFLPVTAVSLPVTVVYTALLAWGFWVGVHQIYQGFRKPLELLNPLFRNRIAIWIFTAHIIVVSLVLFINGPLALHFKSRLWYWGGAIAILSSSLPVAAYFNRNSQSFGNLIGRWVRLRNLFEVSLHVAVAAAAINWFHYYVLLWWVVAYRYLDVGPRRLFQTFYNTPEKRERRPWAPTLNWVVIATLYVLAFLAVDNRKVIYAVPPAPSRPLHVPQSFEIAIVVGVNIAIALAFWVMVRIYTGAGPAASETAPVVTGSTGQS